MANVVVVRLLTVLEMGLLKEYVPFRAECPSAPVIVTRLLLASLHAVSARLGQSPGLRVPWGDLMVTIAVVAEFTIETSWGSVGSASAVPNVLQNDFGAPNECPKNT